MGQVLHYQDEQESKQAVAEEISLRVGILDKCEMHDITYFVVTDDFEDAYKLGNSLITKNDSLVSIFKNNRKELSEFIKNVTDNLDDCCSFCEKIRDRD
ncbi:MAG: hypothetical protein HRT42_10060 [Campylobacteraceae bacterium]|nr:hypothetical protein [Campylobacteraceae bacterium]